ncbi:MAG: hypothetical protein ACXABY_05280 [Candidatus Thorarchaeota archaeon]|jgi:DNA-directed RNA polymerase subunit RPC12/RpoP
MPHFWDFMSMGGIFIIVIPIAIIVLVIVLFRLFRVGAKIVGGFTTEAPAFVIPKRSRGQVRPDGTDIRTVRLPSKCSNCGALLSQSDIQWVGPLEAKCNYCGSSVRAQFEKI